MKKKIKIAIKKFKRFCASIKKNVYVSFGENCLPDDILIRHKLKSYSTPFSSGRGNIEYILNIENDRYRDFLNPNYLQRDPENGVVRLNKYCEACNVYLDEHMKGFEFTHHDVLKDTTARENIKKRCERQLAGNKRKNLFIFYFHRNCIATNEEMLCKDLEKLNELYAKRFRTVNIILFYQRIVSNMSERCVRYFKKNNIHIFEFYTMNEWRGGDENIFWARCDDDLIRIMIDKVKKISC